MVLDVHEGDEFRSPSHHGAFWLKPVSILGLFWVTARSRAFTSVNQCHPSWPLVPLDARRHQDCLTGFLSISRSRVVVSGLLTVRYLPASPLKDTVGGTTGSSMVVHMEQLLMQPHVARTLPNQTAPAHRAWFHSESRERSRRLEDATDAQRL